MAKVDSVGKMPPLLCNYFDCNVIGLLVILVQIFLGGLHFSAKMVWGD